MYASRSNLDTGKIPTMKTAVTLISLSGITIITRLIFKSKLLYSWDSVNFAYGMQTFDIVKHRPHPPGYILYVSTARFINFLAGDENSSLVLLSIAMCVLAVIPLYALGKQMFNERYAVISVLLFITSPIAWFYSEVALSYEVEAFFSVAIAYACYRVLTGSVGWGYIGVLLLGMAGGFQCGIAGVLLPQYYDGAYLLSLT